MALYHRCPGDPCPMCRLGEPEKLDQRISASAAHVEVLCHISPSRRLADLGVHIRSGLDDDGVPPAGLSID